MTERYLVTCALPYANGPLHVGHIRSTYLPGDIYARYLRLRGKESLFICSTDEHGTPITVSAEKEGISPIKLAEKYHKVIKGNFEELNIKFDHFLLKYRATCRHKDGVREGLTHRANFAHVLGHFSFLLSFGSENTSQRSGCLLDSKRNVR